MSRSAPSPRLAYVTGTYPVLPETFVTGELRELSHLGEHPVVLGVLRGDGALEGAPAASWYVVELTKRRQLGALAVLILLRPRRTLRALLRPERRFGGSARDVAALSPVALALRRAGHVHAHFATLPTDAAGRLSELTGAPFSFTAHAHDIFTGWERMEQKLSAARFAVTVCEYNRRYMLERLPWAADKLHVVICGVDVERFRRRQPYEPEGPLVAVGRLVEQKGFEYLVRAAAAARGAIPEVIVAGEGPERPRLEALIGELSAPVRLVGAVPHDGVRELYEGASAAVLPCVVARDGSRDSMPVSLKEAMALELPVVGTREVGIPELVAPERGLLVPPRDVEALAGALTSLSSMPPARRMAMGRAGRAFVAERCNLRTETQRLQRLFELGAP